MADEFREIYANIPGAVRGLFHDAAKGQQASEQLKAQGLSPHDLEVIPITPVETRRVARSLMEVIGLRKAKKVETVVRDFNLGDLVLLVRLGDWNRDKTETALHDLGADQVTYFAPPGEGGAVSGKISVVRATKTQPQS
jgi:hypothetical protein